METNKYLRLANKFANREKIIGTTVTVIDSPFILRSMNKEELDFILFDAEHGIFDTQKVAPLLNVCRILNLPAFVRAQDCEYHLIAKAVDMGADGVMIPRVETMEQMRTAVDALLFYPEGKKGCGGYGQMRPGERFEDFSKTRFLLPQIESPAGIKKLPEILNRYGKYISAVMIGPYDLSVMVGTPLDIHSDKMNKAVKEIFDISNSYGKSCGIFCDDGAAAEKFRAMGCNVLWTGADTGFLMRGFNEELDYLKGIK